MHMWIFDDLTLYFFTSDVLYNLNQTAYILKQIEYVSEYPEELIKTVNVGLQPQIFWFRKSGMEPDNSHFKQVPSDTNNSGLGITLWEPLA